MQLQSYERLFNSANGVEIDCLLDGLYVCQSFAILPNLTAWLDNHWSITSSRDAPTIAISFVETFPQSLWISGIFNNRKLFAFSARARFIHSVDIYFANVAQSQLFYSFSIHQERFKRTRSRQQPLNDLNHWTNTNGAQISEARQMTSLR